TLEIVNRLWHAVYFHMNRSSTGPKFVQHITFYHPYPEELDQLSDFDLNDWRPWCHPRHSRRRAWILQTWLRLKEAGHPVSISATLPESGIVVVLPDAETKRLSLRH